MPTVSKFARTFRLFERLFPPSAGKELFLPGEVTDQVQLIVDPFQRFALMGAVFRSQIISQAMNAGSNTIELNEPPQGFIQIPLSLTVLQLDAAQRTCSLFIVQTTSTPDPWGRFAQSIYDRRQIANGAAAPSQYTRLPGFPCPRGNNLRLVLETMTGGNNASVNYTYVEIPGELVTIDQLVQTALANFGSLDNRPI